MINTTMAYKRAIEKNRKFRLRDDIFLKDGKKMPLTMRDVTAYSINEATSTSGKFEIGAAIVKEYKATLNNMDGKFDDVDFEGADISAKIGLCLPDGSWEDLRKGEFRIVEAKAKELTIDVKAYDRMLFFDRPYTESTLAYPASINQILTDACFACQMTLNARTVQMGNYVVKTRPDDKALTFRDVVSYCAQIMGCYARINNLGQLEFGWYDFKELKFLRDDRIDGGAFDNGAPYVSGDCADGGNFTDWDTAGSLDGGEFTDMEAYHHIYLLKSKSIHTNDITITGISIIIKKEEDDQEELLMHGEKGYVLELSDNPLIQEDAQSVLQHIGDKIVGNTFRPMNITTQSDPSMEAGDLAVVTDRGQRSYWTVITNTTFSLSGSQKIECSAETPVEKNYTRYSAVTKIMSETEAQTKEQLSAYEIYSRDFSALMARSMGLYETYEKQEDGSIIKYQHDKPLLSESKTIWKQTADGFGVSTDGGKTWNAGTDAEGNAVYNVLSARGINADWINAGEISADIIRTGTMSANRINGGVLALGGANNENGELYILNKNNNIIGKWNNEGMRATGDIALSKTIYAWMAGVYRNRTYTTEIGEMEYCDPITGINYTLGGLKILVDGVPGIGITELQDFSAIIPTGDKPIAIYSQKSNSGKCMEFVIKSNKNSGWEELGCSADFNIWDSDSKTGSTPLRIAYMSGKGCIVDMVYAHRVDFRGDSGYGIYIYAQNQSTSGWNTVMVAEEGYWFRLYRGTSSTIRVKDLDRDMNEKDILELYNIRVVLAKFKNGVLTDSDERNGIYHPMFIAEDVNKHFPVAVDHDEKGNCNDWNQKIMIPAMFQMIKSQKETIDTLTERIQRLEEIVLKGGDR